MPATSKPLPRDASGIYPVASVYNAALDRHEAVVGASGAMAVRVADGADEALGSRADAPAAGDLTGAHTLIAVMKEGVRLLRQQADLLAAGGVYVLAVDDSVAVTDDGDGAFTLTLPD